MGKEGQEKNTFVLRCGMKRALACTDRGRGCGKGWRKGEREEGRCHTCIAA